MLMHKAQDVCHMGFGMRIGEREERTSAEMSLQVCRCARMSLWRWLLLAAMAHPELREDFYLRIPSANAIRHDVGMTVHPEGDIEALDHDSCNGSRYR